jgi:hypothetical protein
MGASGIGPFENDSAEDLLDELREAEPAGRPELIREALRAAAATPAGAYLQKDVGETAVAAAALALAEGSHQPEILHLVVAAAHRVLQDDSEVRRLWEDVGAADEWARSVEALAADASARGGDGAAAVV